jgi:hypothetical protein
MVPVGEWEAFARAYRASGKEGGMEKTVARLNIEHYRQLLATETDEVKRLTLTRLLTEEEAKLRVLSEPETTKRPA